MLSRFSPHSLMQPALLHCDVWLSYGPESMGNGLIGIEENQNQKTTTTKKTLRVVHITTNFTHT